MAIVVRQVKRYQLSDWFTDIYAKSTNAERQRTASQKVIEESKFLHNETDNQTKWDQYSTDCRLANRISSLRKWKENLERILAQLDQEIADLSDAKETSENFLENLNLRTDVAVECLTLREGRRIIEVVVDDPEIQLQKEVELVDGIKKIVHQRISDAFEQLFLLQEARQQLLANLQDKNVAMGIDLDQYNLSDRSLGLSYKSNSLTPKGNVIPIEQWDFFSRYNNDRAQSEIKLATKLREQILHTIQKSTNELDAQRQATDFALRKRVHETERAIKELDWQKKNTEEAVADMDNNIRSLEESIRSKKRAIMKAETRLDNRSYRPNVELCADAAHLGLVDEVKQLQATSEALKEKLNQAHQVLDGMQRGLRCMGDDKAMKIQTLNQDKQCLNLRQKLKPPAKKATEQNLGLLGIEKMPTATLL